MRTSWSSLLSISFLLGCAVDGSSDTSTTLPTTTQDGPESSDTTGDGDGDGNGDGDGDGDGDSTGDGDGDPGDGGFCLHQCRSDADCFVNGMDADLLCIDNFCSSDSPAC